MEEKKEPQYLDLSAHAEVNLKELLEKLTPPKEVKKDDNHN